jgi:hypothetical protein
MMTRITMTARQGEFLPKPPGNEHNIRGKWYGIVTECVGGNKWGVSWDNGQSTTEKSSHSCADYAKPRRIPLLQLSPQAQAPRRAQSDVI